MVVCEVTMREDGAQVRLVGELDLAQVTAVDEELRRVADERPRELVIDLRGLTFIDSSGLRLLVNWARIAQDEELALSLIPGEAPVQRVFTMTGVAQLLPFKAREPVDRPR
jgi:anti-anti-sigma factor